MSPFCSGCGNNISPEDKFCRVCGRAASSVTAVAVAAAPPSTPPETSGKAIVSLISGLFFFVFPLAILAIIFGHLSLSEIRKSAGRVKGDGIAIAGLVLGYAGVAVIPVVLIVAAIAIPNLLRARMAANEASAVSGIRILNTAEVAYSESHPNDGFTCSLSTLADAGLFSGPLAKGQKDGYAFELNGCTPEDGDSANRHYQVVAYPLREHQTGIRAFCSNESMVIKVDPEGSTQRCLESGEPLR
ncbi:MAG TPA: DUF4190 domain-containing protein [Candidatus Sulfotelmatobacter sp.]|nr:DUF4190 domain-containing protein [Candidatus Sulfotelmatobacter sp.]